MFAYFNPIQLCMDHLTVLWLNAFALNLQRSVKMLAVEQTEPPYLDVKIEAIMLRVRFYKITLNGRGRRGHIFCVCFDFSCPFFSLLLFHNPALHNHNPKILLWRFKTYGSLFYFQHFSLNSRPSKLKKSAKLKNFFLNSSEILSKTQVFGKL